jgi:hypothetical protein
MESPNLEKIAPTTEAQNPSPKLKTFPTVTPTEEKRSKKSGGIGTENEPLNSFSQSAL